MADNRKKTNPPHYTRQTEELRFLASRFSCPVAVQVADDVAVLQFGRFRATAPYGPLVVALRGMRPRSRTPIDIATELRAAQVEVTAKE
jgi:hypothetical protein